MMFSIPLSLANSPTFLGLDSKTLSSALFWLGIVIFALIIEAMTTDLVSVWFAPGALVAMILAVFSVHWVVQIVVCLVISIGLMVLAKTVFKKYLHKRPEVVDTSVSSLVGRTAVVEEEINNQTETGVLKINGQLWRARMEDDAQIAPTGAHVKVLRVSGTKLICQPLP